MPDIDNLALLLKTDAGWTRDVASVGLQLFDAKGWCSTEFVAAKLVVLCISTEGAKTGRKMLAASVDLRVCFDKTNSRGL